LGKDEGGPDRWMTCEWKLGKWSEDPDTPRIPNISRRENKNCLGIVEFTRHLLHLFRTQPHGLRKDSKLVASEDFVGENISRKVSVSHEIRSGWGARLD
jgi:hypothetical protein